MEDSVNLVQGFVHRADGRGSGGDLFPLVVIGWCEIVRGGHGLISPSKVPMDFNGYIMGAGDSFAYSDVVDEDFHDFSC